MIYCTISQITTWRISDHTTVISEDILAECFSMVNRADDVVHETVSGAEPTRRYYMLAVYHSVRIENAENG